MKCFNDPQDYGNFQLEITGYILAKEAGLPVPEKMCFNSIAYGNEKMNLDQGLAKSALNTELLDDGRREHALTLL